MLTKAHIAELASRLQRFEGVVAFQDVLAATDARRRQDYEARMQRRAAVLVPLCNVNGEASVLFTVRSENVSTHRGQVAFPGGHVDEGETHVEAALRELREETALRAQPIGPWAKARAITGTMVTPIVGVVVAADAPKDAAPGALEPLSMTTADVEDAGRKDPDEVAQAFSLTVRHLCDPKNASFETLASNFRALRYEGGAAPVWGLSSFFLNGILKEVAPLLGLRYELDLQRPAAAPRS